MWIIVIFKRRKELIVNWNVSWLKKKKRQRKTERERMINLNVKNFKTLLSRTD